MPEKKELGKIEKVNLGYYDGRFGITFDLFAGEWNVTDFWGTWAMRSDHAQWTLADQDKIFVDSWRKLMKIMEEAKVDDFHKLVGKPIEVTTDGMMLKSWRILTEVI